MLHGHADTPAAASRQPTTAAGSASRRPALEIAGFRTVGLAEPLALRLGAGEIVGLAGLPGSGAAEFLRGLFGLRPASASELRIFGKTHRMAGPAKNIGRGLAYVTGDRQAEGLIPDASVVENIAAARNRSVRSGPRQLRRTMHDALVQMQELKIRPGDPDVAVRQLSGGNQQKVVFARWMLTSPRLWLLDDATRGVDIGARQDIHAAVRQSTGQDGGAALVVSSDVLELFDICDRIVVFRAGKVVADTSTTSTTPAAVEALAAGTEVTAA
jgi:ABC-type sugar transport system ATPase subunit